MSDAQLKRVLSNLVFVKNSPSVPDKELELVYWYCKGTKKDDEIGEKIGISGNSVFNLKRTVFRALKMAEVEDYEPSSRLCEILIEEIDSRPEEGGQPGFEPWPPVGWRDAEPLTEAPVEQSIVEPGENLAEEDLTQEDLEFINGEVVPPSRPGRAGSSFAGAGEGDQMEGARSRTGGSSVIPVPEAPGRRVSPLSLAIVSILFLLGIAAAAVSGFDLLDLRNNENSISDLAQNEEPASGNLALDPPTEDVAPESTSIAIEADTPRPTNTPQPTSTLTPTDTPTAPTNLLVGTTLLPFSESFDNSISDEWEVIEGQYFFEGNRLTPVDNILRLRIGDDQLPSVAVEVRYSNYPGWIALTFGRAYRVTFLRSRATLYALREGSWEAIQDNSYFVDQEGLIRVEISREQQIVSLNGDTLININFAVADEAPLGPLELELTHERVLLDYFSIEELP